MAVKCVWASIDERGKASGGQAGDQTGGEVKIGNWYYFNQNIVLRPKNAAVASMLALHAEAIAKNNNVGYDQSQRTTLYYAWKAAGWDNPAGIKVKCECDCSALIAADINSCGITVSSDIRTATMRNALLRTGQFELLTNRKYLTTDVNLKTGDIIVAEGVHTILVCSNGANIKPAPASTKIYARGFAKDKLNVYSLWSGKTKVGEIAKGTTLYCYGTHNDGKEHPDSKTGWVWWAINPEKTKWVVYTRRITNTTNCTYSKGVAKQDITIYDNWKNGKKIGDIKKGTNVLCYGSNKVDSVNWWLVAPVTEGWKWIIATGNINTKG